MTELVLHEAAVNGEWQTLESMLMIHRIDIDHKDEDFGDRTALHWAASKGRLTWMIGRSYPGVLIGLKAMGHQLLYHAIELLATQWFSAVLQIEITKILPYFSVTFHKTFHPLVLVGYGMIIGNSALRACFGFRFTHVRVCVLVVQLTDQ